jgi:type III secretory pathway component EscS
MPLEFYMGNRLTLFFDEIWPAGLIALFCGAPLMCVLLFNGFGFLPSAIVGLLVGLFSALAFLSEEYPIFRISCAIIGAILAALLSHHASFSIPVSVGVIGFGSLLGYFARKWIEVFTYIF